MMRTLVEHHHLVLFCSAKQLLSGALAVALHQYAHRAAHLTLVRQCRELCLQVYHLFQAAYLHLLGHIVGQMFGGVSAGALAVLEHKGGIVAHLTHQRERQLVVFLRFAVITHKDVGGDGTVGHYATDGSHPVEIPLTGVFSVHQVQYAVAAALYGQVDVLAHIGFLGYHLQRFVAHVLGMRGGEAHTHFRHLVRHHAQQLGKAHPVIAMV